MSRTKCASGTGEKSLHREIIFFTFVLLTLTLCQACWNRIGFEQLQAQLDDS
jgi:hypothetical protein